MGDAKVNYRCSNLFDAVAVLTEKNLLTRESGEKLRQAVVDYRKDPRNLARIDDLEGLCFFQIVGLGYERPIAEHPNSIRLISRMRDDLGAPIANVDLSTVSTYEGHEGPWSVHIDSRVSEC
jgi:hypothetical protein